MQLKGKVSASLVLLLTLFGTVALFNYANQFKKDSSQALQVKVKDMELQRLEEEKGKQASQEAREAAEALKQAVEQIQKKAEAMADASGLRQPHRTPAQRQAKMRFFLAWVKNEPVWQNALLTDENGLLLAAAQSGAPRTLSANPEFKEASKQRMTVLRLQEKRGRELVLQITVPCLTNLGELLGVFQAEVALAPAVLNHLPKKTGVFFILGTPAGRRLTEISLENFPNNLGSLGGLGKNPQEMEAFIGQSGANYFKGDWNGVQYLIGEAPAAIPGTMVFSLLEVSSLQKLIEVPASSDSLFKDPVIVGGLAGILILGLLISLFFTSSGESGPGQIDKLNEELRDIQRAGEPWSLVQSPGGGAAWDELAEAINGIIKKLNDKPAPAPAGGATSAADQETLEWQNRELGDLREERNRLVVQNRDLETRVESLSVQNQQMRETTLSPQPVVKISPAPAEAPWPWAEASHIRIEAIVNMSDDLKATLTVIKNYISSLLASEEGKMTDTQQEFLGVVINKSARLERQINDFLDFSHLETEAAQMFLVPTDIVPMLQDVALNVQPQADTKQIKIIQDNASHLPLIRLNSDRLGQVLINLVQHALRVTPVGGEVRCSAVQLGDEVVVKIIDGGVPLTPDQAGQVFANFHGPDSKTGAMLTGTGLRFPIMKGIIDAHHGTIFARGLSEQGNEIVIKLPLAPEAKTQANPGEIPTAVGTAEPGAENEQFFDLTTFMENRSMADAEKPPVPGGEDNLDDLLRNIENINNSTDS
jgi:signal transduction histidine kinase